MTWGEAEAHHKAVELDGEVGDGQEQEIDGDRTSRYRARRGRLEASWLDWIDEKDDVVTAKLQSCSW
jgi:hypothetical protein